MNIDGTLGDKYQLPVKTRPYDFGTDAIERQRVSLGQSLIDADFEYGLQATKWQTFQELRRFPSFFEIPGSDYTFSNIVATGGTDANITVYFSNTAASFPPPIGTAIAVQGLANSAKDANRAEGFFLVTSNVGAAAALGNTCNYISKSFVSASNVQTTYSVIRRGGVFNNGAMKLNVASISATASNVTVTTLNAHGMAPGTPITSNAVGATFNGNFFVSNILSANSFNVSTSSALSAASAANSNIYMNPYSFAIHRPFDGGVILSPAQPSYGASIVRQSKKVFRYQSGKGLLWSSGTLFCPNNDIASMTVSALTAGSNISVVSSVPNGLPQAGATIIIKGVSTANINGTYTVSSVVESTTANIISTNPVSTLTPILGDQARFIMSNWHGASVRAGCFDDQNGLFWEYDGQTLFVVRRSSTFQLSGTVTTSVGSQLLTGSSSATSGGYLTGGAVALTVAVGDTSMTINDGGHTVVVGAYISSLTNFTSLGACWVISVVPASSVTLGFLPATSSVVLATPSGTFTLPTTRFQDQLKVNDKFVIRGMTHQVTSIQGQGILTFNPPYRGSSNITSNTPVQACKIKELRVAQGQFNRDPLDGTGASGFRIDLTKMQMIGLQYTWYGAGFVDFMVRGADGNWVYAHRMRNNNINDEAYMRTGNMPVRYELANECQSAITALTSSITSSSTIIPVTDSTIYFPPSGTLMIDNELIAYSSKTANSFTVSGSGRAAALNYNVNDQFLAFTGQPASTHLATTTVSLASLTCTPSLTHWGSALLMDGNFDGDRGYFFNYANTAVSLGGVGAVTVPLTAVTATTVFNSGDTLTFYTPGTNSPFPIVSSGAVTVSSVNAAGSSIVVAVAAGPTTAAIPSGTVIVNTTSTYSAVVSVGVATGQSTGFTLVLYPVTSQFNVGDTVTLQGNPLGGTVTVSAITVSPPSLTLAYTGTFSAISGNTKITDTSVNPNTVSRISSGVATAPSTSALAFLLRLAPSVSNGIVGDIGNRDLLNRAQLLLQKLEVTSDRNVNVTGILNPTGLTVDSTKWVNINSAFNGSQPSFAQIYTGAAGTAGPGERIFSTIVQANNQNNLDLSALKEMANSVIGGNQIFPDGPDVLAIVVTNLTTTATAPQVNLFWTEAQA